MICRRDAVWLKGLEFKFIVRQRVLILKLGWLLVRHPLRNLSEFFSDLLFIINSWLPGRHLTVGEPTRLVEFLTKLSHRVNCISARIETTTEERFNISLAGLNSARVNICAEVIFKILYWLDYIRRSFQVLRLFESAFLIEARPRVYLWD